MRELLISAGSVAAALVLVGAIVFGARDGALLVPPPDAVAEQFGRQLASARYELSRSHLSSGTRRQQSARIIQERFEPARRVMGKLNQVQATELSRDADRASAMSELQGETATIALMVVLRREHGLWMIESWETADETAR